MEGYSLLKYEGTEYNGYVYLVFAADSFDVEIITKELNIEPTSIRIKGDPRPIDSSWKYEINVGMSLDYETALNQLISLFELKIDTIVKLKKGLGLETLLKFVIYIDMDPEHFTPYFGFNKNVIDFLSATGTTADFDVNKIDTTGLYDK